MIPAVRVEDADLDPGRPSLASLAWLDDQEASVLIVGKGHPMQAALASALTRHGVEVETAEQSSVLDAVLAATPKLIFVLGDAARNGGDEVLSRLRTVELAANVPVVVLAEDRGLISRLRALRAGAAVVVPRSASVDAVATRVAELARHGVPAGAAPPVTATLDELLRAVGESIAERVLRPGVHADEIRLALREDERLVRVMDEFVSGLSQAVVEAEPMDRQGGDDASAILGEEILAEARSAANVAGMRIVVVDSDVMRADLMARVLRGQGAEVLVTGPFPHGRQLDRLGQLDAMAILFAAEHFEHGTPALVDRMKGDPRLRWGSLLIETWDAEVRSGAALDELFGRLAATGEADASLRARASAGERFDTRLEVIGPARTLRALAGCSAAIRMSVFNPRLTVHVEISDGIVVGARADVLEVPQRVLEGAPALAALLGLGSGRVAVEPLKEPTLLNLMTTVSSALGMTDSVSSVTSLSIPPPPRAAGVEVAAGAPAAAQSPPMPAVWLGLGLTAVLAIAGTTVLLGTRATTTEADVPARSVERALSPPGPSAAGALAASVAPAPTADPAPSVEDDPAPEVETPEVRTLVERATAGDQDAIAELEAQPVQTRTVEEAVALAQGRTMAVRAAVKELRERTEASPELLEDPGHARQWMQYARDPVVAREALLGLVSIPSPRAADMIYEVWVGTPGRTVATQLAEELVRTDTIRQRASDALGVALDLRAADTCEATKALLPAATEHGDRRSLHLIARLNDRRGCGPDEREDCYPCLRKGKDILEAVRAVRSRPGPKL